MPDLASRLHAMAPVLHTTYGGRVVIGYGAGSHQSEEIFLGSKCPDTGGLGDVYKRQDLDFRSRTKMASTNCCSPCAISVPVVFSERNSQHHGPVLRWVHLWQPLIAYDA